MNLPGLDSLLSRIWPRPYTAPDDFHRSIYKPIRPDQTRLVKFDHDGNQTSARLEAFPLEGLPPYFTLSYAWGLQSHVPGANDSHLLRIGEEKLRVITALHSFFQVLAEKDAGVRNTWWWIDSICINLEDMEERSQQVQLMGEIYRRAQQVVIWLGEGSDDTACAINFMNRLNKTGIREFDQRKIVTPSTKATLVEDIPREFQLDRYQQDWNAVTNFCQRGWCSRVWTLQEYAISQDASFWCGMLTIDRLAVEGALLYADKCMSFAFKEGDLGFRRAWNRRRVHQWVQMLRQPQKARVSISLLALAAYSSCFEATDDRDRLYGLQGLAEDTYSLHVDYTLSVEETYLKFAKGFIEHHKSLDVICFAAIHPSKSESMVPSWVPDWRATRPCPMPVPSMVSQSAKSHIGNFRDPRIVENETGNAMVYYCASKDLQAVYNFSGSKLFARGTIVDVVDGLGGSQSAEEVVQSSTSPQSDEVTVASDCLPPVAVSKILHNVCTSLVLGRQDRYLRFPMPLDEFFRDFAWMCAQLVKDSSSTVVPEEFRHWFNRTRQLRIQGYSLETILNCSNEVTNIGSSSPEPALGEWISDSFVDRFFDTIVRMFFQLMVTRNGHIGLVPQQASKGDLVCVLFGCSVPVLLRPCKNCVGEETFTFVGECFLDGFMEGQGLDDPDCSVRDFCIE